jgi:hypothetical protein
VAVGGWRVEAFYGFIGGENNQWEPALYEPPATAEEGYHLTDDLTDRAVSWIRQQKALMPDKPFFVYFATGATHAPHHVPKEWADRYAGEFDDGWDVQRERTFARQKELGVIPADAELTARHAEITAWDDMPDELKPVLAREMEVYAGFLEHTDGTSDYSQAHNLAAEQPEMLAKLQRLWLIEATKYHVLPMDDRTSERLEPAMAGRPTLIRGNSQQFFPGMGRLSENSVVSIKNKSFSLTAEVDVPDSGADGVIIAQGGRFGGWALYAKDGRAKFVYNTLGIHEFATAADDPIPSGTHQVRMEFAYDGGGLAKGGDVTLYYDGKPVGTGRVETTQPMVFSADETTDIGYESGTTVSPDYAAHGSRFTGKINWVQIGLGTDDHDHFVDPDERLRIAMARQ